jgi:hypothetical protein
LADVKIQAAHGDARYRPLKGKTYTLFGRSAATGEYYRLIKELADLFLRQCADERELLSLLQRGDGPAFFRRRPGKDLCSFIRKTLRDSLSAYTGGVRPHLRSLPLTRRFDGTLATKEEQYHLYMLEIELVNRAYRGQFKGSGYKFALLPHCLRDFRPDCRSVPGDIEEVCGSCTKDCFIHLGSRMLKRHGIEPYISVEMDQEGLFKRLKAAHPSIGALGIACVPELVRGMRLCIRLGIAPIGVPLDANRCARWMGKAEESSFSLEELEGLLA